MHGAVPLGQWLFEEAKKRGIRGATMSGALAGTGHDGVTHTTGWFDMSDQPVQVTMIVSAEESDHLFAHLSREKVRVFYTKAPVSFGMLGDA